MFFRFTSSAPTRYIVYKEEKHGLLGRKKSFYKVKVKFEFDNIKTSISQRFATFLGLLPSDVSNCSCFSYIKKQKEFANFF